MILRRYGKLVPVAKRHQHENIRGEWFLDVYTVDIEDSTLLQTERVFRGTEDECKAHALHIWNITQVVSKDGTDLETI